MDRDFAGIQSPSIDGKSARHGTKTEPPNARYALFSNNDYFTLLHCTHDIIREQQVHDEHLYRFLTFYGHEFAFIAALSGRFSSINLLEQHHFSNPGWRWETALSQTAKTGITTQKSVGDKGGIYGGIA